ncbi:MAG TPA: DNA repair protein RecO [Acidobacteriota bacterium]|nr:DNA repair protein RecO [Acidobacteriota bacterium]
MALKQASGYALRTRPLGEADLIVDFYTREHGRVRAVAKSARRIKSRFGSAFEPFTRSRIVYFQRDKDDLGRVSSCELERSYFEALGRPEEATLAAYLAELIIGFAPEHDASPTLYRLIGACFDSLEVDGAPDVLMRYFEVWMLRLSGLLPGVEECSNCGQKLGSDVWVSDVTLGFLCGRTCGQVVGRSRLAPAAQDLLVAILRNAPGRLVAQHPDPAAVRGLGAVTRVLIVGHLDRTPRSLRVMQRLRRRC